MPYKPKQATAIFLDLKRREGLAAAKAFGAKHREDFGGGKGKSYRSRKARAEMSSGSRSDAAQRGGQRPSRYNHPKPQRGYNLASGNNQRNKKA